jgi:hypothetical protein
MKKKGISAIVATILIILIVVVGVGIVWKVILPIFAEIEYLSYSDVRLNIVFQGYTVYDPSKDFAFVQIGRGQDDVNVTGLEIGFIFEGNSKTYQTEAVPEPGGRYTYKFNFSADGLKDQVPSKVTVAPIFRRNNKFKLGKILDEKPMPSGNIHMSPGEWEEARQEATQNILVIHPFGGTIPGVPENESEVECVFTGVEICGNGVDEDCVGGVDDGCDVLGYFFAGDGVENDPYIIENCFQLQNMSYDLDGYYELKGDVDCSMTLTWDGGKGFKPVGEDHYNSFEGVFDGKGFEISGLFINRGDENSIGLFGYVKSGEIMNLGMTDSDITGASGVGGIAGSSTSSSTITNSYNTGSVSGTSYVSGIAGSSTSSSTITNSYNTGSITGSSYYVGGITGYSSGYASYSTITNSYNTGSITGSSYTGGIAGISTYSSTITNSYNAGSITSTTGANTGGIAGVSKTSSTITNSYNTGSITGYANTGGIAGISTSTSTITNSYNTGSITGSSTYVGGITGHSYSSTITNSYNIGSVTGSSTYVGGIAGSSSTATSTITNSYNTGSITGHYYVGGITGYSYYRSKVSGSYYLDTSVVCKDLGCYYGRSKISEELKQESTYTSGWDFTTVWDIDDGNNYPYLR